MEWKSLVLMLFLAIFGVFSEEEKVETKETEEKKDDRESKKLPLSKEVKWKRIEFAEEEAAEKDKLIMFLITKSWCKPCHKLAKALVNHEEFKELSKEFSMAIAADDDSPVDPKYDIDGNYAPRIIFQDTKGNILRGFINPDVPNAKAKYFYKTAEQVVNGMKKALAKGRLDQGFGKAYDWKEYHVGLEEAKKAKKPILMIIHQDWCSSCQRLKPKFASSTEILEVSKDFIMINVEDEDIVKKEEYKVDGEYYPKILILDHEGKVLTEEYNIGTPHKHVKFYYGEPPKIVKSMKRVLEKYYSGKAADTEGSSLDRGYGKHIDWKTYQDGLALAKQLQKPMMLLIHKSYCSACKALKPKFRQNEELAELSKQFVMVNCQDDEEPTDAQYDIDGAYIPRIFFLDANGKVEPSIRNENEEYKKVRYAYGDGKEVVESMRKALAMNLGDRKTEVESKGFGDKIEWFSFEDGLKEAKKSHRAMMLIIHNSWCKFSQAMKEHFRTSEDIQSYSWGYAMVNVEDDEAPTDGKYAPDGIYTPRIIFLDPDGNVRNEVNNTMSNGTDYADAKFYYHNASQILQAMKNGLVQINTSIARGWGEHIQWQTYAKGLEIAQKWRMPMMVIIHRTWCGACKALKPKIRDSYDIWQLSKEFVMVNLEDDEEPEDTQFLVDGGYYPRIFILDQNGKVQKDLHNEDLGFLKFKFSYAYENQVVSLMRAAIKKFKTEGGTTELPASQHTTSESPIQWIGYHEGLSISKENKKPILLLIHRTSCPACKAVHRMLVRDEKFLEKSKDFVMIEIEDDTYPEIADTYDIDGKYVPRIYFLDFKGNNMVKIWNIGTQYQQNKYYYYETLSVVRSMEKAHKRNNEIINEESKTGDKQQTTEEEIKLEDIQQTTKQEDQKSKDEL